MFLQYPVMDLARARHTARKRALGMRMDPTLLGQDVQQDYLDVLK
jgi:hypothetical protein